MGINKRQIDKIVSMAKGYGATRLILFGSAAAKTSEARDWDRKQEGLANIENVYSRFKSILNEYMFTMMPKEE